VRLADSSAFRCSTQELVALRRGAISAIRMCRRLIVSSRSDLRFLDGIGVPAPSHRARRGANGARGLPLPPCAPLYLIRSSTRYRTPRRT
jgi:hypothetical protein